MLGKSVLSALSVLGACLWVQPLSAETIYYDGGSTGTGSSLTYDGLSTTVGGLALADSRAITALGGVFGGNGVDTTLWMSFVGYRAALAGSDGSAYAFNVDFTRGSTVDVIGVGGYRSGYTTTGPEEGSATYDNPNYWAVTALDGTTQIGERTRVSSVGALADLILLKIDYDAAKGSDQLSLWINPSLTGGEENLGMAMVELSGLDLGSFDGVRFYAGSGVIFNLDEFRLATTFDTVVPEPSTYAFLLGVGALGVVAWRRRR